MTKDAARTLLAIFKNIFIGIILGIANVIPGVSGGTMAASFGIYDQLIQLISHLWSELKNNWRKNLLFLIPLGVGAAASILLFSKLVTYLLENYNVPTNFFFIGVILGSIPLIFGKTVKPRFKPSLLLPFLVTLGIMVLMAVFRDRTDTGMVMETLTVGNFFLLLLYGVISAASMIIPGISGSFILVLIGSYSAVMKAVSTLNIPLLIPFAIGALLGLVFCAKAIGWLLERFEQLTYAAILGFVLGSILTLFPAGFDFRRDSLICLAVLVVGGAVTYLFNRLGTEN